MICCWAAGNGKIYMGCALGIEACKQRFKIQYFGKFELLEPKLSVERGYLHRQLQVSPYLWIKNSP